MIEIENPYIIGTLEHLPDVSCYNHNYYRVSGFQRDEDGTTSPVGEFDNIILEECHEDENYCEFERGYFDENGEFQAYGWWDGDWEESIEDFVSEE